MLIELEQILGDHLNARGFEVRFCCVACDKNGTTPDTNYHLYVNTKSGKFFCQRCEFKGHVSFLIGKDKIGSYDDGKSAFERFMALVEGHTEEEKVIETSDLPDDFVPLVKFPGSQAAGYLESRGIGFELAVQRGIGFGTRSGKGGNKGRIIFPVFDREDRTKCIYWVGRSYANASHKIGCECWLCKRRYTNAEAERRNFIYGLEFVEGDEVCVAEGVISALNCGSNAVATFGKYVAPEQVEKLCSLFKTFYIALDPDAKKNSIRLMRTLLLEGKRVFYVTLPPGKDPADLGEDAMMELRANALEVNRSKLFLIRCAA